MMNSALQAAPGALSTTTAEPPRLQLEIVQAPYHVLKLNVVVALLVGLMVGAGATWQIASRLLDKPSSTLFIPQQMRLGMTETDGAFGEQSEAALCDKNNFAYRLVSAELKTDEPEFQSITIGKPGSNDGSGKPLPMVAAHCQ